MEPGIYIDLPEQEYFADDAIGGSGLKSLVPDNAIEFWWNSSHNPVKAELDAEAAERPDKKDGKMFGKALHKAMLEGQEAFDAEYCRVFDASQYPNALDKIQDFRDWFDSWNEDNAHNKLSKSGTKDVMMERIKATGQDVQFVSELRDEYVNDRIELKKSWHSAITLFARITDRDPYMSALKSEGIPEVSVFWEEDGVPCRMRLDWFRKTKVVEIDGEEKTLCTTDLKSYSAMAGRSLKRAILTSIMNYRYDLQEAHYRAGVSAMKDLPIFGGTDEQQAYIKDALTVEQDFGFLFYKSIGAPITKHMSVPAMILDIANREREYTFDSWRSYYKQFGYDIPWVVQCDEMEIEKDDFPPYFGT